jgi:hypothetical protein
MTIETSPQINIPSVPLRPTDLACDSSCRDRHCPQKLRYQLRGLIAVAAKDDAARERCVAVIEEMIRSSPAFDCHAVEAFRAEAAIQLPPDSIVERVDVSEWELLDHVQDLQAEEPVRNHWIEMIKSYGNLMFCRGIQIALESDQD